MENPSAVNQGGSIDATRSSHKYVAWGCSILFVVVACTCVIAAGLSFGMISYFGSTPKNLSVDYELPNLVTKGEKFHLVLIITNTGETGITVGDIDLDEAFGGSILDGAIVLETDPHMDRDYSIPGIKTFRYNRAIPAGESQRVVFQMQATTAGEYGGSIGIYVGDQAYRIDTVTITITEK